MLGPDGIPSPYHLRRKWLSTTRQNRSCLPGLDCRIRYCVAQRYVSKTIKNSTMLGRQCLSLNCSWDNGDFVSTWLTSAGHGGCRRMACHKDLYWNLLSSTCRTSTMCQQQRAGNSFMLTTSALPTKHGSLKISTPPSTVTLTLIRSANLFNAGDCSH